MILMTELLSQLTTFSRAVQSNTKFYSKFYETAYMQELIHSIFSTLLSFTLTLLFLSISNVLYRGEGDMSMKSLSYIVSNICFQVFVAFFKIHECTQITMGPLMYPDFHVKNDRFLFPLDLP